MSISHDYGNMGVACTACSSDSGHIRKQETCILVGSNSSDCIFGRRWLYVVGSFEHIHSDHGIYLPADSPDSSTMGVFAVLLEGKAERREVQ